MTARTDAVVEAIYKALERWDAAERRARDLRSITKANVTRRTRTADGSHIPSPRRSALALYLADAAVSAIAAEYRRQSEAPVTGEEQ